jgi:tetratricopeptide (TPR) repeat protein
LLGSLYQHREQLDLAQTAYQNGYEAALDGGLEADALEARLAVARLDRLAGDLERAVEVFEEVSSDAQESGLEVISLESRLELGLCAWTDDDPPAAHALFEDVRRAARGNLFGLEFYAGLGSAWALAAQNKWTEAELVLMQAEDLRFDVRLHDAEAERLRRSLRDLAAAHRRRDLVERINKLDVMVHTTHDGANSSLSFASSDLTPGPPEL